jgi:putative solute:sodium symporter small subunit
LRRVALTEELVARDGAQHRSPRMKHHVPASPPRAKNGRSRKDYWRANLRLIATLLAIWALVSYGCGILFVEWLNQFRIGELPLGFWFAQQGSIYVFVVLIFVYAWRMDRLDRKFGVSE